MRISHDEVCSRSNLIESVSNQSFFVRNNQQSVDQFGNLVRESVYEECKPDRLDHLKVSDFSVANLVAAGVDLQDGGYLSRGRFVVLKNFERHEAH